MHSFDLISGLIPAVLQAGLLLLLLRRRLYRIFPFFTAYTIYSLAVAVMWLCASPGPATLFVLYWITQMIYGVLSLLAILEIFKPTLGAYFEWIWIRLLPTLLLLGIAGVSLWRGFYHPVGRGGSLVGLAAGAYTFMLGVLCLQIIVLVICLRLTFRKPYPVRWGRYRLGILAGFGLAACASAAAYMVRFLFGARFEVVFHYVLPGAYIGAAAGWLLAFWRPEPPRSSKPLEVYKQAADLMLAEIKDAARGLCPF